MSWKVFLDMDDFSLIVIYCKNFLGSGLPHAEEPILRRRA
jgi:hypothetical protein